MKAPPRLGDTVRLKDRSTLVGRLIRISENAALIERPDGTRYADVPGNLEAVRSEEGIAA